MMNRDNMPGMMLTFVLGAGVGAAVALLLAPKSGEELRGDIADGVNDGVDQIRYTGRKLKRRAQKFAAAVQENVEDAIESGKDAYNEAKKNQAASAASGS